MFQLGLCRLYDAKQPSSSGSSRSTEEDSSGLISILEGTPGSEELQSMQRLISILALVAYQEGNNASTVFTTD